jgi:hypothetical protein
MKKLVLAVAICVMALWATMAWAEDYTGLGGDSFGDIQVGAGGIFFTGDDNATPSNSQTEFVPTVNIHGLTDMLAWQAFYGFGADSTVMGGSLDYIVANNFDKCFTMPDMGTWWFGVGPSIVDVNDLYFDKGDATAGINDTLIGGNLGFGYNYGQWSFNIYAHYLDGQIAGQGMVLYNFNYKKK